MTITNHISQDHANQMLCALIGLLKYDLVSGSYRQQIEELVLEVDEANLVDD